MAEQVVEGVYRVGGAGLSHSADCLVYALDLGVPVLVDCGAGPGWPAIREQMRGVGLDPAHLHTLLLTHAHVDHIGAGTAVVAESGCRVVAHEADAPAIESGDPAYTAASWYGMTLPPLSVDHRVRGEGEVLRFPAGELRLQRTPGHTPGSMVAWLETGEGTVLFGQDIHGPFDAAFDSDIERWRESMEQLLDAGADVLCEGHYGVHRGRARVRAFIEEQLRSHGMWRGGRG